jgi:23S rRNA pseudouridine1911/1915/1917 synthase
MLTDFLVSSGERSKRLDVFLVNREPRLSRTALQRLILLGRVRLNGRTVRPGRLIRPGDRIVLDAPQPSPFIRAEHEIPLDVLFEDDHLIVVVKPPGIVAHPGAGHWGGTLMNALLHHFGGSALNQPNDGTTARPGLVHRLDKDTSGVMVVAKTRNAHRALAEQFARHSITRIYEAFVRGIPRPESGHIDLAIGRDRFEPKRVSPDSDRPKPALTTYEVRQTFGSLASRLRLHPKTGRTHQLRAHLHSLGHPILGDTLYAEPAEQGTSGVAVPRLMLHASTLGFRHPATGIIQSHSAPMPSDMGEVLKTLPSPSPSG